MAEVSQLQTLATGSFPEMNLAIRASQKRTIILSLLLMHMRTCSFQGYLMNQALAEIKPALLLIIYGSVRPSNIR